MELIKKFQRYALSCSEYSFSGIKAYTRLNERIDEMNRPT